VTTVDQCSESEASWSGGRDTQTEKDSASSYTIFSQKNFLRRRWTKFLETMSCQYNSYRNVLVALLNVPSKTSEGQNQIFGTFGYRNFPRSQFMHSLRRHSKTIKNAEHSSSKW